jgi:hypothetical protein
MVVSPFGRESSLKLLHPVSWQKYISECHYLMLSLLAWRSLLEIFGISVIL